MKRLLPLLFVLALPLSARGANLTMGTDADSGFSTIRVTQGHTEIAIAPAAGANVYSIRYKGTELLKGPKSLKNLPGFMYGVPVLYPTPNRVRGGEFTFGGQKFTFPPNDHGNFLHGLVHSAVWELGDINVGGNGPADNATLTFRLPFAPGSEQYKLFPLPHTLELAITSGNDSVRWTYTVDNRKGDKPIPYGFAIHPWFLYQGSRKDTFVTIPATQVMEAKEMLPTGKLLDLAQHPEYDARQPRSLEGFLRDDVYAGIDSSQPALIDFRQRRLKITLSASDDFKHLVLYTPKDQPWFCVEDQTCSTDAHNLYAQGLKKESNLLIVEPGKTASGWIEMRFANY
ncbi:MAG TPA: aldose 1-epimerase [Pirellulales bacterium]|jgi:aldose 1-epimerase|nr:aldose 1-epimerase [Pirellulales bacterium]